MIASIFFAPLYLAIAAISPPTFVAINAGVMVELTKEFSAPSAPPATPKEVTIKEH